MRPWFVPLAGYLAVSAVAHLAWEAAHVRLYTLWRDGTVGEIRFAVLHCTGGDAMIASAVLLLAWLVLGRPSASRAAVRRLAPLVLLLGLGYTAFSEWYNIAVRGSWAYTTAMPLIPGTGLGLTPMLQWIVVPLLALGSLAWFATGRGDLDRVTGVRPSQAD